MINSSPIEPAANRDWLIFESTDTSAPAKRDHSHADLPAHSLRALSRPFRQSTPTQSPLLFEETLFGNIRLTTDQRSSLQSP